MRSVILLQVALAASSVTYLGGCDRQPPTGGAVTITAAALPGPEPASPPPPPSPSITAGQRLDLRDRQSGERVGHVVHAPIGNRDAVVYLHGKCADPAPDLEVVRGVTAEAGTLVAPIGDLRCGPGSAGPGNTEWSGDVAVLRRRVDTALSAAAAERGGALDLENLTVIGESQGATRAVSLATAEPDRYRRLVLVGGPYVVTPDKLPRAEAVITLAGDRDRPDLMMRTAQSFEQAGRAARFLDLPGAAHGEFGAQGESVLKEALSFARTAR